MAAGGWCLSHGAGQLTGRPNSRADLPLLFHLSSVTLAHSTPRILSRIIENINCGNYVFLCKIRKSGVLAIKNRGILHFSLIFLKIFLASQTKRVWF